MIDHTAVNVSDQEAAKAFYSNVLEPLGYSLAFEAGDFLGFADANGMDQPGVLLIAPPGDADAIGVTGQIRIDPGLNRTAIDRQRRRRTDGNRGQGREGEQRKTPPHSIPPSVVDVFQWPD